MSHIIAIANQKGGVAKTTTALNLAAALASQGQRTLVIDSDPQANLTVGIGLDPMMLGTTMTHVMRRDVLSVADAIHPSGRPNLDIVPSDIDLAEVEVSLVNAFNREKTLANAMTPDVLDTYDFIIIDSPPNLGMLAVNVLSATHFVIIPVATHFYSLQGLSALLNRITEVKTHLNPDLMVLGILPTRFDARTSLGKEVLKKLNDYGRFVFSTHIRESVRLAEAPAFGKTVFEHDPGGSGAAEYAGLARELQDML